MPSLYEPEDKRKMKMPPKCAQAMKDVQRLLVIDCSLYLGSMSDENIVRYTGRQERSAGTSRAEPTARGVFLHKMDLVTEKQPGKSTRLVRVAAVIARPAIMDGLDRRVRAASAASRSVIFHLDHISAGEDLSDDTAHLGDVFFQRGEDDVKEVGCTRT